MPERAYTVSEIDKMRATVGDLVAAQGGGEKGAVEDRLRTYMLAGIAPDEMEHAVVAAKDARDAQMVAKFKERNGADCVVRYTNWRGEEVES